MLQGDYMQPSGERKELKAQQSGVTDLRKMRHGLQKIRKTEKPISGRT